MARPELTVVVGGMKHCGGCGEDKPLDAFYRNRAQADGRSTQCKDCLKEHRRRWAARNPERVAAHSKRWREDNPEAAERAKPAVQAWRDRNKERIAAYNRRYLAEARARVIAHYGGACTCCGETEDAFLTIEHKEGVPESHMVNGKRKSGAQKYLTIEAEGFPQHLTVLCFNCNLAKAFRGRCPHEDEREAAA